jgi:transcriptional regulator with XRE-family HTH domain
MKRHNVLGERLKELREKRGLSQVDFGKRTGLGHRFISGIENGRIVPNIDILEKMTTALGVPLHTPFLTDQDFLLKVTQGTGPPNSFEAI